MVEICCDKQDIINDNHEIICINCGSCYGYELSKEYIDFYEYRHRIMKKSIYHRKYHIENTLHSLNVKYNCNIDCETRRQILQVFRKIKPVIVLLNKDRKRMVDVKYIIKKLLEIKGINTDSIPVTKCKKHCRNIMIIGLKF